MTRSVITVNVDSEIKEVAAQVVDSHVSGFPVVTEDNRVVGIITEGDLIRRLREVQMPIFMDILGGMIPLKSLSSVEQQLHEITATKVKDLMTTPAITVKEATELEEIADMMVKRNIKRVPVVDDNERLLGIVSRNDLVRAMVS
jgi:CBS domain-containing protein